MKHNLLLSFLLLLFCAGVSTAQTISQKDAKAKALSFLNDGTHTATRGAVSEDKLVLSYKSAKGNETYFYIFNEEQTGAFVIVAGDERATEILGYGDHGCLDYDKAPDNFKWWMSQYELQIHEAIQQNLKPAAERQPLTRAGSGRVTIPDMIKTQWNQNIPYNSQLPSLGPGYTGSFALATGCVATAMAQVMNYHKYPAKGTGSNSYTGIKNLTFEADFENTNYNWDNMLDSYKGTYNTDEANAVATLMYHCGVALNTAYGQIGNGGSAAYPNDIPHALITYFGYDKSAQYVSRNYYTDEEWTDLIYSELQARRPVLYGGKDAYKGGGHQFVCHGYNADDNTFAINWGWGGSHDGYFTLIGVDGLQPNGTGIGGAGEGASYTNKQDIIINVMPDQGTLRTPLEMYCNTNNERTVAFDDSQDHVTFDLSKPEQSCNLSFYSWNRSNNPRIFETSLMFRDIKSGAYFYAENKNAAYKLDHSFLIKQSVEIKSTEFQLSGNYEVLPVVREAGEAAWQLMRFPTSVTTPTITIIEGRTPEPDSINFTISSTSVEQYSSLTISHDKIYTGSITYTASPEGIVSIDDDGVVTGLSTGTVTITASGTADTYFFPTSKSFKVNVTPYVKKDMSFSISNDKVMPGMTLLITHNAYLYEGIISYSSSNPAVATVDAKGVITGIASGSATITASIPTNVLYNERTQTFDIKVLTDGITLIDLEVPDKGYITFDNWYFLATVANYAEGDWNNYRLKCYIPLDGRDCTFYSSKFQLNSGKQETALFDIYYAENGKYIPDYYKVGDQITLSIMEYHGCVISDPITFTFCDKLSYTYTMTAAGWGTLCLPFEADIPDELTAYKVTGTNGESLILEEVDFLEMNTPYLLSGTPGDYLFEGPDTPIGTELKSGLLVGNTDTAESYAPQGSYVLQIKDDKLGFYKVKENNTQKIRPYSAYLTLPGGGNGSSYSIMGTTDIEQIESLPAHVDGNSYQLDGTRVTGQQKGLIIKNGRLIFVK